MTGRVVSLCLLMMMMLAALPARVLAAPADQERAELQARFRERFPTLVALKRADKVGETYKGLADAVRKDYLDEPADPKDPDGDTIRAFLAAENRDRQRLYELIAEETGTTAALVAQRDAERRFEQAKPREFLQPSEDRWVRKRDL